MGDFQDWHFNELACNQLNAENENEWGMILVH